MWMSIWITPMPHQSSQHGAGRAGAEGARGGGRDQQRVCGVTLKLLQRIALFTLGPGKITPGMETQKRPEASESRRSS